MTENVYWPHEEATKTSNKVEVTIIAWDYEQKRGTAMLPDGHFVTVAMTTVLMVQQETPLERTKA